MDQDEKISVSFRIDKKLLEEFDQKNKEQGYTRSESLRHCILNFVNSTENTTKTEKEKVQGNITNVITDLHDFKGKTVTREFIHDLIDKYIGTDKRTHIKYIKLLEKKGYIKHEQTGLYNVLYHVL